MCNSLGTKTTICYKIVDLVVRLCDNSQAILKERNHNQESAKGG
jgi:hypothetical protein